MAEELKPDGNGSEKFNFGDSVGVVGLLVGVVMALVSIPLPLKIALLLLVLVCCFLFMRKSHWTYSWRKSQQYGAASILVAIVAFIAVPQYLSEWKTAHPSATFNAPNPSTPPSVSQTPTQTQNAERRPNVVVSPRSRVKRRAHLRITRTSVLISQPGEGTLVRGTLQFINVGDLPIKRMRYGFQIEYVPQRLAMEQEDELWDRLERTVSHDLIEQEIPVGQPAAFQEDWNAAAEIINNLSSGARQAYFMALIRYSDQNGNHQTDYCGLYKWHGPREGGVYPTACVHHNRDN